jgi:hypothetical protein
MSEHSRFVLLVSWPNGIREQVQIPTDGRGLTIGTGEAQSPVEMTASDGAGLGLLVVCGPERPEWLVCPSSSARADSDGTPEWLAEFMHELGLRHNLRSPDGCEQAMHEAQATSDSFGFRCRSCASLARGYRSAGGALAAIAEQDQDSWARHNHDASRHFREAVELARKGEEVAA